MLCSGEMILAGEDRRTQKEDFRNAILLNANPSWIALGENTTVRGVKPVTNGLGFSTGEGGSYKNLEILIMRNFIT
jgi:hypothetical protein